MLMAFKEPAAGASLTRRGRPFSPGQRIGKYPLTFRRWNLTGAVGADDPFFQMLHRIEQGMVPITAAGLNGAIEE
jgi:hypothetical protein